MKYSQQGIVSGFHVLKQILIYRSKSTYAGKSDFQLPQGRPGKLLAEGVADGAYPDEVVYKFSLVSRK